ncbi:MAG: hypothetical protein GVY10_08640 [Verrucomicrobia bacterium]|jgi:hypothetical protein|nr:hypothetical protein [Verrucomicrobiota bacterium]
MKKKLLLSALVLLVVGILSLPVVYSVAKGVRSHQHLSEAKDLKTDGEDRTAYFKIQSAYNLAPDSEEALRLLGAYAAEVYHPRTLEWWTEAADKGLLSFEETIDMIRYGLGTGEGSLVRPYLYDLEKEAAEDPRVQVLRLQFLEKDRRHRAAFRLARTLLENGHGDREVLGTYINAASSLPGFGPEERREAMGLLRELSRRTDPLGLEALRTRLAFWTVLSAEERQSIEDLLVDHPEATITDNMNVLSLRLQEGLDPDQALARAEATFNKLNRRAEGGDATTLLASFTDWLVRHSYLETSLRYLEDPRAGSDPDLFHTRQLALILSGSPEDAYNLSLSENPLQTARNLVLRAMAQSRMDEEESVHQTLTLAAEAVEESEVEWMDSILIRGLDVELLIHLFEQLETTLENPGTARVKLLAYYYSAGDENGIERMLREVDPRQLTTDVRDKIPFLYFRTLYREDLPETRALIEELVTEMPDIAEFRVLLSFAYTVSGKEKLASELLEQLPAAMLEGDRMLRIMMASIHLANRELPRAITLADGIDRENLLPQERSLLSELLL